MFGCHRVYPPSRPDGAPSAAAWAGGFDGGGWVTCSSDTASEYNLCTIYDEEGRSRGPARYKLKGQDRAAHPSELRYSYVTGRAIGHEGGRELVQVSPNHR